MAVDLNALTVFQRVAACRSFTGAAEQLGVTRSAVSQTVAKLEQSLGIALVLRTTRSVNLTDAGQALLTSITPALTDLGAALDATQHRQGTVSGQLRLAVSSIAETFLAGPLLASFAARYPALQVDITVSDEEFDIVNAGFDAGVRLGEVIAQDMVAVPVSGRQRQLVVCSPAYRDQHPLPVHPRELGGHRCIGWRSAPGKAPYRWEFEERGREFSVDVQPEITSNDMGVMARLALAGAGIAIGMEETWRPWLQRGELVSLLEPYCPRFAGFFLYYPSRRQAEPKLRALVEHVLD
ncbi:TPA: LysR family transcriptional regulator [Stenotrophomonas maltophilia]|uniref:LysR family transcriptional regulator n=1 Tax=Stenotrophomonas sp. TaxID=69392 RepID=UPI0028A6E9B3|nr:LysR family transcriptional regulator [Stenotrophomonas sp.]HDS1039383.1 LysR family transcriptional regulator [Stenotrophomonas maltophilia]HDS1041291.1 LysR family transcriptional regulator [Stenotrophomonas maltophilia]HDS1043842.1 LysR family transcriptional regulator [Stenotrophomonas maltophilia]HDS1045594.1 LysR family transcriptional regulator [Stenotrophomonas maltophilia]